MAEISVEHRESKRERQERTRKEWRSQDKNTICNYLVMAAADLMEAKAVGTEMIIEMRIEANKDDETVAILREFVQETRAAIDTMRYNAGCWS